MIHHSRNSALVALVLCGSAWPITARADLIAYWSFDEVRGGATRDHVGKADGTIKGKVTTTGGRWGGALEFAGAESYVDCGKAPVFSVMKAVTVATWVKAGEGDRPEQAIVTKGQRAWRLFRQFNTGAVAFACAGVRVNTDEYITGATDIQDGRWHHVVGGYSGAEMFLYIDGVLERREKASGTIATNDQPVLIGAYSEGARRGWNGLIDEVLIFDRDLTDQEIAHLYRLGAGFFTSPELVPTVQTIEKVRSLLQENRPQEAASLIQSQIATCEQGKQRCARDAVFRYDAVLSELHSLAGQAGQMMNSAPESVRRSFRQSLLLSVDSPDSAQVLAWLYVNLTPQEYSACVSQMLSAHAADVPRALSYWVRDFLRRDDWTIFVAFLNVLLECSESRTLYATIVTKELEGHGGWLNRFRVYCWEKPGLRDEGVAVCERLADREIQAGRFPQAILLYREILQKCDSAPVQTLSTWRICQCHFAGGQYLQAIEQADRLMQTCNAAQSSLATQAGLIRARSYARLGQFLEAVKACEVLRTEHPNTAEGRQAGLVSAYAQMAAGQIDEARKILSSLATEGRDEPTEHRARLCLSRLDHPQAGR